MTDAPDDDLYTRLTEPIDPESCPVVHDERTPEEIYETQRILLRANRPWRRALRLHWWRLRYLLVRGWAAVLRPWDTKRAIRRTRAYSEYFEALHKYEEAKAAREALTRKDPP